MTQVTKNEALNLIKSAFVNIISIYNADDLKDATYYTLSADDLDTYSVYFEDDVGNTMIIDYKLV